MPTLTASESSVFCRERHHILELIVVKALAVFLRVEGGLKEFSSIAERPS